MRAMTGFVIVNLVVAFSFCPIGCSNDSRTEAVFEQGDPFDLESYEGMTQFVSTRGHGDEHASLTLYVKTEDGYERHASLEIKGTIVLGAEGILGYPETFLRINFSDGEGDWKEIRRKSIQNGRLYIETEGDRQKYTISGVNPRQYGARIERGIVLPSDESDR